MKPFVRAAALLLALSAAHPVLADGEDPSIVGAWRMTLLEARMNGTFQPVPLSGQIIFTDAGTMSAQAMVPEADAPDTAYTVRGYEAYYGPATIDNENRTFVVTVESSVARDLIGRTLKRNFDLSGDNLVITPGDPEEDWRVTYERLR